MDFGLVYEEVRETLAWSLAVRWHYGTAALSQCQGLSGKPGDWRAKLYLHDTSPNLFPALIWPLPSSLLACSDMKSEKQSFRP
jgi:hypothetical protein